MRILKNEKSEAKRSLFGEKCFILLGEQKIYYREIISPKELLNNIKALRGEINAMNKQIFVKKKANGTFGKNQKERTPEELINYGIVNIDKPKGPTEV